jgi:hypothetical protein
MYHLPSFYSESFVAGVDKITSTLSLHTSGRERERLLGFFYDTIHPVDKIDETIIPR